MDGKIKLADASPSPYEFCIACKIEMFEGPCIGRLCYHCIEESVIAFKSIEAKKTDKKTECNHNRMELMEIAGTDEIITICNDCGKEL